MSRRYFNIINKTFALKISLFSILRIYPSKQSLVWIIHAIVSYSTSFISPHFYGWINAIAARPDTFNHTRTQENKNRKNEKTKIKINIPCFPNWKFRHARRCKKQEILCMHGTEREKERANNAFVRASEGPQALSLSFFSTCARARRRV